jgi:hypothetical protein
MEAANNGQNGANGMASNTWKPWKPCVWYHSTDSTPVISTSPSSPIKVPPNSCVRARDFCFSHVWGNEKSIVH